MREAFRRILWIVPTLLLISVGAFALVSAAAPPQAAAIELPLFLNLEPRTSRDVAQAALADVAAGGSRAAPGSAELVRLGGAALPHVLPQLDALEPVERSRVAVALLPVARRMGIGGSRDALEADEAVVFWNRYWQDRQIDFRPSVVRRAVRRYIERPSDLRRLDIVQLDTYALGELVRSLGTVRTDDDVSRVRRVASIAAHVTRQPWRVPKGASLAETRLVVDQWRTWWTGARTEFETVDGATRIASMVTETRYGRWARDFLGNRLGTTGTGESVLEVLVARGPLTGWLVLVGLVAGWLAGVLWGMAGAYRARGTVDRASSLLAFGILASSAVGLAHWLAPTRSVVGATFLVALATAATVSRHQRSAGRLSLGQEYVRAHRALGASPWRAAARAVRPASAQVVSLLPIELPIIVTSAFVAEHAMELPGIASFTVDAVLRGDVVWMLALTLVIAAAVAMAQIASDRALLLLDPRARVASRRREGLE